MFQLQLLDPDDGSGDTVHVPGGGAEVDLVPLVKPNRGRGLGLEETIPRHGFRKHPSRLNGAGIVRVGVGEDGEDDIEAGLLHNQARAGELHQGGDGRGA